MTRVGPEESEAEAFELAVSTSHLLHRAQQLAGDRFTLLVGDNTVTLRQFAALAAIAKQSGQSQAELVRDTGIDRSTLADMMLRMEKRGWITRSASESDGRANAVHLSQAGVQVLTNARHHARAADAAIMDALPKSKRKAFLAALEKLSKVSDKAAAKAERDARRLAKEQARREAKARAQAARAAGRSVKGKRKRKTKAQSERTQTKKKLARARDERKANG